MPTYLPQAELTALLPTGHGFTSGELDAYIAAGSSDADAELAHLYWTPFTDYDSVAGTSPPWQVRTAAAYFAASRARQQLNLTDQIEDNSSVTHLFERARIVLEPFRDGKQQLPPETSYTQVYAGSWGDGDPYTSSQAPLGITRGEYIPDSGRVTTKTGAVTDHQLGEDFVIYYYAPTRKWLVERINSTIGNQALSTDGDKVYYDVSRIKKREVIQPGLQSIQILRA